MSAETGLESMLGGGGYEGLGVIFFDSMGWIIYKVSENRSQSLLNF